MRLRAPNRRGVDGESRLIHSLYNLISFENDINWGGNI